MKKVSVLLMVIVALLATKAIAVTTDLEQDGKAKIRSVRRILFITNQPANFDDPSYGWEPFSETGQQIFIKELLARGVECVPWDLQERSGERPSLQEIAYTLRALRLTQAVVIRHDSRIIAASIKRLSPYSFYWKNGWEAEWEKVEATMYKSIVVTLYSLLPSGALKIEWTARKEGRVSTSPSSYINLNGNCISKNNDPRVATWRFFEAAAKELMPPLVARIN
jgi:hypothetical protein